MHLIETLRNILRKRETLRGIPRQPARRRAKHGRPLRLEWLESLA
jgi:hypothetical protein